jgi:hypothetical protein
MELNREALISAAVFADIPTDMNEDVLALDAEHATRP